MTPVPRSFQVFVKPVGAACNLACRYCYYPGPFMKTHLQPPRLVNDPGYLGRRPAGLDAAPVRMPDDLLESYIAQHIAASPDEIIRFSWHGGEPTVLGLPFFRRITEIERRLRPPGRTIVNGLQTNGTLLDDEWGRFLAAEGFSVGLSCDGPRAIHNRYRRTRAGRPAFDETLRGIEVLKRHGVPMDILCVVGAHNVRHPGEVYGFFRDLGASFVTFLPLVEPRPDGPRGVSPATVPAEAWGAFLCAVFDEWVSRDIGRIKVQIVEEAARAAFGQEHSLCIFRPECGDIPVLEQNGDVYACDHFVDAGHLVGNIRETSLAALLESPAQRAFGRAKRDTLPVVCRACEVLEMCHGECPKNRFVPAPDGGPPRNYLCAGYRAFFGHVRPFVDAVAAEWARQNRARVSS